MTHTRHASTGAAASPPEPMSEDQFRALYERLRGQLPWGPDNRRGALHYLTPDVVLTAMREVKLGRAVSLAAPVEDWPAADNPDPARHEMKGPLGADAGRGVFFGMDRIAMNIHGNADSHIDALCHVMFDGTLHNGLAADTVDENGAAELSIDVAADGIVGRGVLLDVPRSRGVPWLEPGDHVTVDVLLAAERDQGVRAGRGDILLVRVGHRRRRTEQGPWDAAQARAGLHPTVLPVLAERQIAVLGGDVLRGHPVVQLAVEDHVAEGVDMAVGIAVDVHRDAVHAERKPRAGVGPQRLFHPVLGGIGVVRRHPVLHRGTQ